MDNNYDSTKDTQDHILKVFLFIKCITNDLHIRGLTHDASKLEDPEKQIFDMYTPKLKHTTYGSDEYKAFLAEMQVALNHHYEVNRHHPEHFENGIEGMSLIDLIEMICDWYAATQRHADGDIMKSLEINQKRFGYNDTLKQIFKNTVDQLIELHNKNIPHDTTTTHFSFRGFDPNTGTIEE